MEKKSFIAVIVLFFVYLFYKTSKGQTETQTTSSGGTSSSEINKSVADYIYDRFKSRAIEYTKFLDVRTPPELVLAMICMESGSLLKAGKKNNEIIGDNNTAFGVCQVRKGAYTDVKNNFSALSDYDFGLLKENENINLLFGTGYLTLALRKGLNKEYENPYWFAFKGYNGGTDETYTSYNKDAILYANKAYKYFEYLKSK